MFTHGLWRHVVHHIPTVELPLWHWLCHGSWYLANSSLQTGCSIQRDTWKDCTVLRSCPSLIDHCDRLVVAEILHRLVEDDGCVSNIIKRDGVVSILSRCTHIISKLHTLRRPWSFVLVFHGRRLCHEDKLRQLLPGSGNTVVRPTMLHRLKEVVKSAVILQWGMVHMWVGQKVMPINLIVRQNQPLQVEKSAQKAQMT